MVTSLLASSNKTGKIWNLIIKNSKIWILKNRSKFFKKKLKKTQVFETQ